MSAVARDFLADVEPVVLTPVPGHVFAEPGDAADAPLRLGAGVARWARRAWTAAAVGVAALLLVQGAGMVRGGVLPAPPATGTAVMPGQQQTLWDAVLGERPVTPLPGYPRLVLPRLGISLPIGRGDGRAAPDVGSAWLLPGTALGAAHGGFVYAPNRGRAFDLLHLVRAGDVVEVVLAAGGPATRYSVAEGADHAATEGTWLTPGPGVLVLETPDGYEPASPRFLVIARLAN